MDGVGSRTCPHDLQYFHTIGCRETAHAHHTCESCSHIFLRGLLTDLLYTCSLANVFVPFSHPRPQAASVLAVKSRRQQGRDPGHLTRMFTSHLTGHNRVSVSCLPNKAVPSNVSANVVIMAPQAHRRIQHILSSNSYSKNARKAM